MWFDDEGLVLSLPLQLSHVVGQAVVVTGKDPCVGHKVIIIFVQLPHSRGRGEGERGGGRREGEKEGREGGRKRGREREEGRRECAQMLKVCMCVYLYLSMFLPKESLREISPIPGK